ncbi:hypothetical protein AMECASPLE_027748 [Ameca splendens]|uniref:Uncharacterized protein n=1 Tax=Ameca splendens TaxID=208324 RepID=A0ABV0YGG0_9TELE
MLRPHPFDKLGITHPAGYASSPVRGSQASARFPGDVIPRTFSNVTCRAKMLYGSREQYQAGLHNICLIDSSLFMLMINLLHAPE